MDTEFLFRENAYLRTVEARVAAITDRGGIMLDQTVFYATSGGQPGDIGSLELADGTLIAIASTVHGDSKTEIVHVPGDGSDLPSVGDKIVCHIDWDNRYKLMRVHTALHLLSVVVPLPVTGGSIGAMKGRLDFNMPEAPKDKLAIEGMLNGFIKRDLDVTQEWISETYLEENPDLVKTMAVKPPSGQGRIRMIRIGSAEESVDWQPCGGTHVAHTGEIGKIRIGKIEKKGALNRRVYVHLDE